VREVAYVDGLDALVAEPLGPGVSAVCWTRALRGDFDGLARALAPNNGSRELELPDLTEARHAFAGATRDAIDVIIADLEALEAIGAAPSLSCITSSRHDGRGLPIAVDVMSFHVDRAPCAVETFLCTYAGACSEGLDGIDAVRLVDDPEIARSLTDLFVARGGAVDDAAAYADFLAEESFDLHYRARAGAAPWRFGLHALWKLAVSWPGSRAAPAIHRAPATTAHDQPRLLLIA
jgi:hypothetical protein